MSWRANKQQNRSGRNSKGSGDQVRIKILAVFFVAVASIIILKLFDLQIMKGDFYTALASDQHELYRKLVPERGTIYAVENRNGQQQLFPLVGNQKLQMLYSVPKEIKDASSTANALFAILGLPDNVNLAAAEKDLFADISADLDPVMAEEIKTTRRQKWLEEQNTKEITRIYNLLATPNSLYKAIRHRLTDDQVQKIKDLNIKGLYFQEETWRFYPEAGMGGQLFGFWGIVDDAKKGQYGLEGYFNKILNGTPGEIKAQRDAFGNLIAVGDNYFQEKKDGSSLILTVDRAIQHKACQALSIAAQKYKSETASVVVINPKTGAIIAMCGYPDYDPDKYGRVDDANVYNNPLIFDAYEPGSIFKAVTMASALDVDKVQPDTTYVDTGGAQYGPYNIKNFNKKVYGKQTMVQVLDNSINTGAIFAMKQATPEVFVKYVKDFNFGKQTGIELSGEVAGDLSNIDRKGEIYKATASFGQGIMVTPLQMAMAYGAFSNGGKLMKPYIVSQTIDASGNVTNYYPQEVRQVITAKTAQVLSGMLVSVVANGHGKMAGVPGYIVGGKTGTAQVVNKSGHYGDDVDVTFAGFAPFSDPRFVMIVRFKKPQNSKEAAISSAPVFSDIAKFILQYYNVPYDNPTDPALKKLK
ncbi:MAG: penicillin-binding protein 2 [bacterium]